MAGRGNGLRAEIYSRLSDLDPRVADAMLEQLRESGIAAYVVPVGHEVSDEWASRLPDSPTDRLYVDADFVDSARTMLRAHQPEAERGPGQNGARVPLDQEDEDRAWREIVAAFNSEPTDPVSPWPAIEDLDDEATEPRRDREADPDEESRGDSPPRPGPRDWVVREAELDEDHYVPPLPPRAPRPDPVTVGSWLSLFGGPGYLLLATVAGWRIPPWAAFLAVAAFIGGFVVLVVRMNDDPPTDSGPDDGAIV